MGDIRDFIEVFSQLGFLRKAIIDGDTKMMDAMNTTFSCFMTICKNRLEKDDFYSRLGTTTGE